METMQLYKNVHYLLQDISFMGKRQQLKLDYKHLQVVVSAWSFSLDAIDEIFRISITLFAKSAECETK